MRVYLDHNATSPLRREALERWREVLDLVPGNPSSLHASGRAARAVLDEAREQVAAALGVHEEELVFTSGGTEANNLALKGVLGAVPGGLVTTSTEHSSVLEVAAALEEEGRDVTRLPVDRAGKPDLGALEARARAGDLALVSIHAANNETGAVPDLEAARRVLEGGGGQPFFHSDAVQALGKLPLDLAGAGLHLASFSAHKVGGPPGVGVLWRRRGTPLVPLLHGGGQEDGLRPGTESAAAIASAAVAIELAVREQEETAAATAAHLRELWEILVREVPGVALVGPAIDAPRLPNTLCVRVPNTDGKVLVTRLDLEGVEASAGSACASGSVEPSHVLVAMGYDDDAARAGLRLSLSRATSRDDCAHTARALKKVCASSRAT